MKNKFEEIWIIKYNIASAYYEHNGNLEIPEKFKTLNGYEYDENGINLGMWIQNQKQLYKKAKLSPERINLLKAIGMRLETVNYNDWNENYALVQNYYEHHGNLEIPVKFKTLNGYEYDENGINLGIWIQNQKQLYKKAKLSPEKINLLKKLGMCFETRDNNNEWNKNYALVQNYYEHHGNLKIPVKFKTLNGYEYDENGISLGAWLATQRQSYKKAKLSPERINLLKKLGMRLETVNYNDWNENYALVQNYYEHHGNLEIPVKFKTLNGYEYDENGINLGIWIQNQKQLYKKANLSPERINLLESIGMKWFVYNNINYKDQNVIFDNNTQRLIKLKILNSFKLYLNSLDQNALPSKAEINQDFLDVLNYTHKKK